MTSMGIIELDVARFILILAFERLRTHLLNDPRTLINDAIFDFFSIFTGFPKTTSH